MKIIRSTFSSLRSFFRNEHLPLVARDVLDFVRRTWFVDRDKAVATLQQKRNRLAKIKIPFIQKPLMLYLYSIPARVILCFVAWLGNTLTLHFIGGDRDSTLIFTFCWIVFYFLSIICLELVLLWLQSYPKMKYAERWTLVKTQYLEKTEAPHNIQNFISRIVNNKSTEDLAKRNLKLGIKQCKRNSCVWFYFNASLTVTIGENLISNPEFQKAFWSFLYSWSLTDMFNVNSLATWILLGVVISWPLYFWKYGLSIIWMEKLEKELDREN